MANGVIGLLDLSIVTDALKALLSEACEDAPFGIDVTGAAPDVSRGATGGACVLSLYLFHIEPDRFQRNTLQAPRPLVKFQPMALDLYYLLTAWAGDQYVKEQKAMSIAFRCLHQNPIVRFDGTQEFTITLETGAGEELSRLWQSITMPTRLSAIFKASVVFIAADTPPEIAGRVDKVNVEVRT